jgi:hypothetical protein
MEPSLVKMPDRVRDARMNKKVCSFGTLDDADEIAYWRTRSPEERLDAVELLRQINYGDDAITAQLQRVFEFAELGAG